MRIDKPLCSFRNCRNCFDGNCIKSVEYDRCEYRYYEDLEEQGRLVVLPCKVGDAVYKICPINKSINMGDMRNGKIVKSDCQRCPYGSCDCGNIGFQKDADNIVRKVTAYDEDWIFNRRNYFGKIYYLDKESAEKALKDMESSFMVYRLNYKTE